MKLEGKNIKEVLGEIDGLPENAIFGRQTREGDGYCGEVFAVIIDGVEKGSIDDDGNGYVYNPDVDADRAAADLEDAFTVEE